MVHLLHYRAIVYSIHLFAFTRLVIPAVPKTAHVPTRYSYAAHHFQLRDDTLFYGPRLLSTNTRPNRYFYIFQKYIAKPLNLKLNKRLLMRTSLCIISIIKLCSQGVITLQKLISRKSNWIYLTLYIKEMM